MASAGDRPVPLPRPAPHAKIVAAAIETPAAKPADGTSESGLSTSRVIADHPAKGARREHVALADYVPGPRYSYGYSRKPGPLYLVGMVFGGWRH
jgi:hypothetical protein